MPIKEWILAQPISIKLYLGLGAGLLIYVLFRWFVYSANKAYQEGNPKKANWKDRLKTLSSTE